MAISQVFANVPEAESYALVYELPIGTTNNFSGGPITYATNNAAALTQPFDRIAYYLELQAATGPLQYVYISVDAFTASIGKIGVPNASSGEFYQQNLVNMNVVSNAAGVVNGTGLATGNIEFWPSNYAGARAVGSPANASNAAFDFGDGGAGTGTGYGSMQIHNFDIDGAGSGTAGQTLFAFNNWNAGSNADLGIGNRPTSDTDWTFAGNAGSYSIKNMAILVRPTPMSATSGDDTIVLSKVGGVSQFTVNGGAPMPLATSGPSSIDGGDGNDTFIVDLSGGNPIPVAGITFIGNNPTGAAGDQIVIPASSQGLVTYTYVNASDGSIAMSSLGTIR